MMRAVRKVFRSLGTDRKAATAVEYGLILGLIVLAMFASLSAIADAAIGMWNNVNDKVTHAQ